MIVPAFPRGPMFLMSAISDLICLLYSGLTGSCQKAFAGFLAAER